LVYLLGVLILGILILGVGVYVLCDPAGFRSLC
jgi:hypothetical protein